MSGSNFTKERKKKASFSIVSASILFHAQINPNIRENNLIITTLYFTVYQYSIFNLLINWVLINSRTGLGTWLILSTCIQKLHGISANIVLAMGSRSKLVNQQCQYIWVFLSLDLLQSQVTYIYMYMGSTNPTLPIHHVLCVTGEATEFAIWFNPKGRKCMHKN